ncbi:MAG: hypothetical protein Q4Q06_04110 [Bacteroidota bacterium]|nr:hypothetical protein [Bacteroidota bacterium]
MKRRIILITLFCCLGILVNAQIDKNKDPYDFTGLKDGIYITEAETFNFPVLIEVKDNYVIGIYRDSICEENKLKAHARFQDYTDLGRHLASHDLESIPRGYKRCVTLTIAYLQGNKDVKYWVVLSGKKKHCWYER